MVELFNKKHPLEVLVKQPSLPVPQREDHTPLLIMFLQQSLKEMTRMRKSVEKLPHDVGAGGG